jgi:integrase
MPGAVEPFRRLKERKRLAATDKYAEREVLPGPLDRLFPKSQRELMNAVLAELGMKTDREGQRRSAYSLRHTYICFRLLEAPTSMQSRRTAAPPSRSSKNTTRLTSRTWSTQPT